MTSSLITWVSVADGETAKHGQELPMSPIGYGALGLLFFLFCLGVLWSFRNTAARSAQHDDEKSSH